MCPRWRPRTSGISTGTWKPCSRNGPVPQPVSRGCSVAKGIRLTSLSKFPEQLDELRLWDSPVPHGLRQRLLRVWAHHELLRQQISGLEAERRALLDSSPDASSEKVRQLMQLKGIRIKSMGRGYW